MNCQYKIEKYFYEECIDKTKDECYNEFTIQKPLKAMYSQYITGTKSREVRGMRKVFDFLADIGESALEIVYEVFVEHHGFWEGLIFGTILLNLLSNR